MDQLCLYNQNPKAYQLCSGLCYITHCLSAVTIEYLGYGSDLTPVQSLVYTEHEIFVSGSQSDSRPFRAHSFK